MDPTSNLHASKLQLDKELKSHLNKITCLIQLNDGRIASCSHDYNIKVYNQNTFQTEIQVKAHDFAILNISQTKNNILLSCGCDCTVKLWEVREKDLQYCGVLVGHTRWVLNAISLNENEIASCSEDQTVKIWDTKSLMCKKTLNCFKGSVNIIHKLSKQNTLIGISAHQILTFIDLSKDYSVITNIEDIHCYLNNSLLELEDDKVVIGGYTDITIIDCKKYEVILKIKDEFTNFIGAIVKINQNEILFGCYSTFYQIDLKTMKCISKKEDLHNTIITGMINLNNRYILSTTNQIIQIWKC